MKVLIIGSGLLGSRLLTTLRAQGVDAYATTTSQSKVSSKEHIYLLNALNEMDVFGLIDFVKPDVVVSNLAPPATQDKRYVSYHDFFMVTAKNIVAALDGDEQRLVFVGSSALYGDHCGAVVDELADSKATYQRGVTQKAVQDEVLKYDLPTILRLGGIFCEDVRSVASLTQYTDPQPGTADRILNFTHVDDAVNATIHVVKNNLSGVFNVPSLYITARKLMPRVTEWTGQRTAWTESNFIMSAERLDGAGFIPLHKTLS